MRPCYETVFETRAFAELEADAIFMDTVSETMVCNYKVMKVPTASCIIIWIQVSRQ